MTLQAWNRGLSDQDRCPVSDDDGTPCCHPAGHLIRHAQARPTTGTRRRWGHHDGGHLVSNPWPAHALVRRQRDRIASGRPVHAPGFPRRVPGEGLRSPESPG